MADLTITVEHEAGLHARPLAQFVKTAKTFESDVQVTNVTTGKGPNDGKSPIKLLLLAVLQGHEIRIETNGADEVEALEALKELVENNFETEETT